MRFETFLARVDRQHREQPTRRYGQILILELSDVRPMLANNLRGSPKDPFHKQHKEDCGEAIAFLSENYED